MVVDLATAGHHHAAVDARRGLLGLGGARARRRQCGAARGGARAHRPGAGHGSAGERARHRRRGAGRRSPVRPHLRGGTQRRAGVPVHLRGRGHQPRRRRAIRVVRAVAGGGCGVATDRGSGAGPRCGLAARAVVLLLGGRAAAAHRESGGLRGHRGHLPGLRRRGTARGVRFRGGLRVRCGHSWVGTAARVPRGAAQVRGTDRALAHGGGRGAPRRRGRPGSAGRHRLGGGRRRPRLPAGHSAARRLDRAHARQDRAPRTRRHRLLRRTRRRVTVLRGLRPPRGRLPRRRQVVGHRRLGRGAVHHHPRHRRRRPR
jgi:hypothetical protein